MKKLKVLILNYEYPPIGGGAATATRSLLRQYAKRGDIEVDLVTSSIGKYKEEQFSKNIRIYFLNIKKKGAVHAQSNLNLIMYSTQAFFKMLELKKKKDYDLVHAFFGIPCGFLAMFSGMKYIVSLRGSDVPFYSKKYYVMDKLLFRHLSRLIWKKAGYVVANSQGLKDLALKTIPDQEIKIIYNGVDWVEKLNKERDKRFIVVSTSRLIERKGIDYLIKAFAEFSKGKNDVELRLYGGGDQREMLENLVKELNIQDKVIFYGEQPREVLYRDTVGTSVFVLPSKNEGMSNCLLESMVRSLPIIATDVGGTRELVDESNGFVVEKENSKQITEALERLYRDRSLIERMGNASREKVRNLSWEKISEEYIKLYKKVADDN